LGETKVRKFKGRLDLIGRASKGLGSKKTATEETSNGLESKKAEIREDRGKKKKRKKEG